jgi:hypothetical protein
MFPGSGAGDILMGVNSVRTRQGKLVSQRRIRAVTNERESIDNAERRKVRFLLAIERCNHHGVWRREQGRLGKTKPPGSGQTYDIEVTSIRAIAHPSEKCLLRSDSAEGPRGIRRVNHNRLK